jgi:hypothetical protein
MNSSIYPIMVKKLFVSLCLTLLAQYGFSQCGNNEKEIKVEISTDTWGDETYWTLKDITGTIILQGGQGGAYGGPINSIFTDSICISSGSCVFFEIYDTFGDGMIAPAGFKLYFDESLVASVTGNFGNSYTVATNCQDSCNLVNGALNEFGQHLAGTITLTNSELAKNKTIWERFPRCLAANASVLAQAKELVAFYDAQIGALFTTPDTKFGFLRNPDQAPDLVIEQTMLVLQQALFDGAFTPEAFAAFPQIIQDWKFNSCVHFPGDVAPPANPSLSHVVPIRASNNDPDGTNPYLDYNQDRMAHALRPTGLYLAPGSVATVTVPDNLVNQGYWVRVGSHDWDLGHKETIKRMDRISKRFSIKSNTIEVFNPMGGAISILVPLGANEGVVEVTVQNGVEAPFFSLKPFYQTADFDAELNKPGPWAVFETDNVMYTIPKHSIVPGEHDLRQNMLDWDVALQAINSIMARQIVPDKHNMYMIADVDIRGVAYSVGYPMSNSPLMYTNVPGIAYFVNGPGSDDAVDFHESGHALAMTKFPGEEEALVNFPYIIAMTYGLNQDINEAIKFSITPNTFNSDLAVTHRMLSNSFGSARDISNTETDEVRYQQRGFGHYVEIVNILGWCPLRNFYKQEYIDAQNGIEYGLYQDLDNRSLRMSVAAQADLRPLFHVFGILPQNPSALQDTLNQVGIQPSLAIYDRLQAYIDLIPANNAEFVSYALAVYPNLFVNGPTDDPNYGVGWHYQKSLTYDAAEAQSRINTLQSIINLYFPNGRPVDNPTIDVCCALDTLNINLVNDDVVVTGGVKPYDVSVVVSGNIKTITVTDFDGCTSTAAFMSSSVLEENTDGVKIYPNPASGDIFIDFPADYPPVEQLQIISINGQVIRKEQKVTPVIKVSDLTDGLYVLRIDFADGRQLFKRIAILR